MTMTSSSSMADLSPLERSGPDGQPAQRGAATVGVETKSDRFAFSAAPDETILMSALSAGYDLPYECATGTCGSCHARVMQGAVEPGWTDAPGYASLRRDKGDVLMCQARATGDCVLRVRTGLRQPAVAKPRAMRRRGRICGLRRLTADVIDFDLDLSAPMDFDAGQFVTLQAPGLVGRRAYSMVNCEAGAQRLRLVVKRKPGGAFSDWLFDRRPAGAEVEVRGPLGRATFRPEADGDIVCVAGGSGLAGMMAIMRRAFDVGHFARWRGSVFFGARALADAFYVEELAAFVAAGQGAVEATLAISHEDVAASAHPQFPGVQIGAGMVHEVASSRMAGRWDDVTGFVAGPPPMVDATLRIFIAEGGLRADRIRFDKFA
ncbi:2Fe-2S iron-sulfur cluster-binding protein [Methylocella sp.]|uniref:2Fe-2S iron-sulfur cluster-binding protein n=1 Tax=Methylocella sp. TaxID=1978226 RepID=UPI0037833A9C